MVEKRCPSKRVNTIVGPRTGYLDPIRDKLAILFACATNLESSDFMLDGERVLDCACWRTGYVRISGMFFFSFRRGEWRRVKLMVMIVEG